MDSVALITIADLLADDVTPTATHEPNLADFFDAARPVDDDGELLAVTAALLRLRNTVDHALARGAATIERVGLPARKHVRSAVGILTELGAAPAVAYRAARLGRACGDTTVGAVTRGMRDGAVSAELGDAVVTGLDHVDDRAVLSEDDRSRVLHSLLVQTTPARVKEKAHAWAIRLAPATGDDGQVPVAERDDLNAMTLDRTDDGRVAVTVDLDVVAGEELSAALDPLTRPVPEPDGSEDKRSAKRRSRGRLHPHRADLSLALGSARVRRGAPARHAHCAGRGRGRRTAGRRRRSARGRSECPSAEGRPRR